MDNSRISEQKKFLVAEGDFSLCTRVSARVRRLRGNRSLHVLVTGHLYEILYIALSLCASGTPVCKPFPLQTQKDHKTRATMLLYERAISIFRPARIPPAGALFPLGLG